MRLSIFRYLKSEYLSYRSISNCSRLMSSSAFDLPSDKKPPFEQLTPQDNVSAKSIVVPKELVLYPKNVLIETTIERFKNCLFVIKFT